MTRAVSPSETAACLREAAVVMHENGLARAQFIHPVSHRVCLEGAIRVTVLTSSARQADMTWTVDNMPELSVVVSAVKAVAAVLPEVCRCGEHSADPYRRVYHFNDVHCASGEAACALLIEAAEKLEANSPEGIPL